jgi:hypothetical protein
LVGAEVGEPGAEIVEAWVGDEGDCGGGDASIDEVRLGEDVVEALGDIDGKLDATESVPRRLFSLLLLELPALEVHMAGLVVPVSVGERGRGVLGGEAKEGAELEERQVRSLFWVVDLGAPISTAVMQLAS